MKRSVSGGLLDYFSKKSRNEDSSSSTEGATSIVNSSCCGSSSLSTSGTSTDSSSSTASGLSTINRFPNDPANGRLPRDRIKTSGPCQPTVFHFPTTRYSARI